MPTAQAKGSEGTIILMVSMFSFQTNISYPRNWRPLNDPYIRSSNPKKLEEEWDRTREWDKDTPTTTSEAQAINERRESLFSSPALSCPVFCISQLCCFSVEWHSNNNSEKPKNIKDWWRRRGEHGYTIRRRSDNQTFRERRGPKRDYCELPWQDRAGLRLVSHHSLLWAEHCQRR